LGVPVLAGVRAGGSSTAAPLQRRNNTFALPLNLSPNLLPAFFPAAPPLPQKYVRGAMTRALLYLQVSVRCVPPSSPSCLPSLPACLPLPCHLVHAAHKVGPARLLAGMQHALPAGFTLATHSHASPCSRPPLLPPCSGQAVVFVVRTIKHSFLSRAGTLTYVAFLFAQMAATLISLFGFNGYEAPPDNVGDCQVGGRAPGVWVRLGVWVGDCQVGG
jgi:hypothetical protein